MFVDTHAHLYLKQFDEDRDEMMARALAQGIEKVYLPNIDSSTIDRMLALEKDYPGRCFPMMGLHPCSVKENYKEELAIVEQWLMDRPFCAVGEIGVDLYWDKTFREQQEEAFRIQINWAKDCQVPIVIHCRESMDICINIVREEKDENLQGIFHCFGGSLEQARAIMDLEFYMGIGGVATYKNSGMDVVLKEVPLSALVLETDAPYLSPVPFRGKRNESAYIHQIAVKLASIQSKALEEVELQTTKNAASIFGWKSEDGRPKTEVSL